MTELLVPAHRDGNARRLLHYRGLLTTYPSLAWMPPDLPIADTAAQLRAEYRLKTPDAIQAATAIRAKVSTLFTNEPIFQRVKELEIFVFDDLL